MPPIASTSLSFCLLPRLFILKVNSIEDTFKACLYVSNKLRGRQSALLCYNSISRAVKSSLSVPGGALLYMTMSRWRLFEVEEEELPCEERSQGKEVRMMQTNTRAH